MTFFCLGLVLFLHCFVSVTGGGSKVVKGCTQRLDGGAATAVVHNWWIVAAVLLFPCFYICICIYFFTWNETVKITCY